MKASVSKGCKITPLDDGEKRFCDDLLKTYFAALVCALLELLLLRLFYCVDVCPAIGLVPTRQWRL